MSDTTATSSVTEVADELDSDDSNSTCLSHSSSSPVKQKPSAGRVNGCGLPSVHVPVSLPSHGHRFNIIQKLNMRQTRGKVMERRGGPEMRLFSRLPGRLAFLIRDTVPHSALTAGHVFMGFSGCGQYLLSYTQTTTDADISDLSFNYYYRLHWWLFVPYAKARKVAEVTLFTDQGVYGNLHISICQWPGDNNRLVVYGHQSSDPETDEVLTGSLHCYLTVTTAPSMNNCQECVKVASSYDADDVAAAWNSCVRLSCLRHGATVHTQFDLVPPYPKFEPKISLKRGGCIVVNTGNFLHAITVKTERLGVSQEKESRTQEPFLYSFRGINPLSPPCNPISVNVGIAEFSLVADGSPGGFSPVSFPQNSDSENTDVESEASFPSRSSRKLRSKRPLFFENSSQKQESSRGGESPRRHLEKMNRIQEFTSKLSPTKNLAGRFKEKKEEKEINERDGFEFMIPSTPGSSDKKRKLADEAYDLTDENFLVDVPEKLSTFRRKRLAEKKYEFTEDEEDQNPYPITRLRYKKMAEAGKVFSQVLQNSSTQDLMVCVSQRNPGETQTPEYEDGDWTDMLDGSAYPEIFSPGGCITKDINSVSPRISRAVSPKALTCSALSPRGGGLTEFHCKSKFTRRYIEVDDELVSVITDIEDDDLGAATGFHSALPLEVHGSGYNQMQMISNSKAEKLSLDCILVEQRSLDLEQFCHETATRLCAAANKKFWFCNDYDVEMVDVDPVSGDVIVVAVVLIQAAILTKSHSQKFNVSSLSRKQYQASFKFCWNIDSGQYFLVDSDPLKDINGFKEHGDQWNPARLSAAPLVKSFRCRDQGIKCLTNESVMTGVSLKAIVDPDNLVALIMNDLE